MDAGRLSSGRCGPTRLDVAVRILLMPSAFHPSVGGVEELTRRLASQFKAQGHYVEIWTGRRDDEAWPAEDDVDGIRVLRSTFPAPRMDVLALITFLGRAAWEMLRLLREIRRVRPDVINVQCFSTNGIYATALSALTGIPLVVSLHGETVMDDNRIYDHSAFLRTGLRLGLRRAAAVTACSRFTLNDAVRFGLDPHEGEVIFNAVSLDEVEQQAVSLPFPHFVLAMGRVVDNKGFDLLLRAWALLGDELPDVGLVIGGDGPALPALRRLAEELGLTDRVVFPGRLSRSEVGWAMAAAEVFVMPSRVEPFGIVALEAWRAGTPVIVSCLGGAPEFVTDGVTGLVVDPFDGKALAASLRRLLHDPALCATLAYRGSSEVQNYGWSKAASRYDAACRRAAGGPWLRT